MASVLFNCQFCGESGRHITGVNGRAPSADTSVCDKEECLAKLAEIEAAQRIVDAQAAFDAAEADLAVAKAEVKANDEGAA